MARAVASLETFLHPPAFNYRIASAHGRSLHSCDVNLSRNATGNCRSRHCLRGQAAHALSCKFFLRRRFSALPVGGNRGMSRRSLQQDFPGAICVNAKQETGISPDGRRGKKSLLDSMDLMELEFGRLLGEDREITMRKVVGKKLNPEVPYLELEQQKLKPGTPRKPSTLVKQHLSQVNANFDKEERGVSEPLSPPIRSKRIFAEKESVPELASPPLRPKGAVEQNTLPSRPVRVIPPVRFGSSKVSQVAGRDGYEGLIQKPLRSRQDEVGLPPALSTRDVIPPMSMKKKSDLVPESKQSSSIDGLVRRPTILKPSNDAKSSTKSEAIAFVPPEDLQCRDDADVFEDQSEQRNREGLFQEGVQALRPGTTFTLHSKPFLPTLESKPTVLEKPAKPIDEECNLQEAISGLDSRVIQEDNQRVDRTAQVRYLGSTKKSLPSILNPSYKLKKRSEKSPVSGEDAQNGVTQMTAPVMRSEEAESSKKPDKDDLATLQKTATVQGEARPVAKPLFVSHADDRVADSTSGTLETVNSFTVSDVFAAKSSNIFSDQSAYPKSKSLPFTVSSTVVDNNAQTVNISLEETKEDDREQLLTPLLVQSKEREIGKAISIRLTVSESAAVEDTASPTDFRRPVLKLHRVNPLLKPKVAIIKDGREKESPTSGISSTAPPSTIVEQSSRLSGLMSRVDSNSYNLETSKFTGEQSEFENVDNSVTGRTQELVNEIGRQVEKSCVSQDKEIKADTVKATWVLDHNSQPESQQQQQMRKMPLRSPPSPLLSRLPIPVTLDDNKSIQLSSSLHSTLRKSIKIRDERAVLVKKEEEDQDWVRAEALRDSKAVEEVTIIGSTKGGLLASFGSLVGYLPAFELTAKIRPQSYMAWTQSRGIENNQKEPAQGMQEERNTSGQKIELTQDAQGQVDTLEQKSSNDAGLDLLELYREERAKYLSLLGQEKVKVKVIVTGVDRTLQQLRFSQKQAEGEDQEQEQKKALLMERLNVGDVVTCKVTKMTTFGAFVELEGVSALIHVSELSWNRNIDPSSVLKVGEEVKVKVCNLDHFQQRINLSLKQMQLDPLAETLESLVSREMSIVSSSRDSSTDELKTMAAESPELKSLLSKLAAAPGISVVLNGRRVHGSALAPAFQVYLSVPLDSGYKLLARFGNAVQEILVETTLDRDQMKQAVQDCMVQDT